ncbi:Hint domain-containing protein [Paracoccus methylarcula]|uniref:Hint domain-containing protein n=1 Tax=Paracoccus methylarcula TaxID=72022 RepID=UPI001FE7B20A|nr:Hint domain-containing protein [Paracoccus methylarcula]
MAYPTEDVVVNGTFSSTVPGTSSGSQGDSGDPSDWIVAEGTEYRVQTVGGRVYFNRSESPATTTTGIYQDVNGVEPSGEEITFSFTYGENKTPHANQGDPGIRYVVYDLDNNNAIMAQGTVKTPGNYTETFAANSTSYRIYFYDVSNGTTFADPYLDNVSLVAPVVCFAAGTLIETSCGPMAVEKLREGDMIRTRDNGLQPIRWIGSRKLSAAELAAAPNLRPIRIRAGAFGNNTPETNLIVSPQHRVLVRSKIAQRMFSADEVLVAAKHLLELDGVGIAEDMAQVEYLHILFDRHEIIFSNGAETESLYTGPEALKAVGPKARDEILALFPELRDMDPAAVAPPARPWSRGGWGGNWLAAMRETGMNW